MEIKYYKICKIKIMLMSLILLLWSDKVTMSLQFFLENFDDKTIATEKASKQIH